MNSLLGITEKFPGKKVIVIGDVMLDVYTKGNAERISPEAPIPVLSVEEDFYSPGGAGNVAANISSLGGKVSLFGFIGDDEYGRILKEILKEKGIESWFDECSRTTIKQRFITRNQQLLRADREDTSLKNFSQQIMDELEKEIKDVEVVVVSDYNKGAITRELMNFLVKKDVKIIVDPKQALSLYGNVFLIKCNEREALRLSGEKDVYSAGKRIRDFVRYSLITKGEKGMMLFADKDLEIPTYARGVYDITGAGDSVMAALSIGIAAGANLEEAVIIANHVAGIAVSKFGTYQVRLSELQNELSGEESKIKSFEELVRIIEDLKKKGKKVIWTNGCFDILHTGHIKYLKNAREQGDYLVVGINSDESVKRLKGEGRPVMSETERAEIISSLGCVDFVLIFPEDNVVRYLEAYKPDVYVKGGDYSLETINSDERKAVENYGGRIYFVPVEENISSSAVIEKIKG